MNTGMVLGSRVDILQDKLLYTVIAECIDGKNLVALEGLGNFY